jgi:hypothetical protein
MQTLNTELMTLNKDILDEIDTISPEVSSMEQSQEKKIGKLVKSYEKLQIQKDAIAEQLREYDTMQDEITNGDLAVQQGNMTFKLLLLLACILIGICITQLTNANVSSTKIIVLFGLLFFVIEMIGVMNVVFLITFVLLIYAIVK